MPNPIRMTDSGLNVPDDPIIPFIEGDGTGPDIWAAAVRVFDAAVAKAYNGARKIHWHEVLAGEKSYNQSGEWLPNQTLEDFKSYLVGIKGPLTTPVGGGIRSLNVALRQILDLYVCLRPVRWFEGVPSPVKRPGEVDMIIYRENSEDIYAGIEFEAGTEDADRFKKLFAEAFPAHFKKVRFPDTAGIGIKPVSREGTDRLVAAAIAEALKPHPRRPHGTPRSVTLVHKGNIMKFTEGAFRDWGYQTARERFNAAEFEGGPWHIIPKGTPLPTSSGAGFQPARGTSGAGFQPAAPHDIIIKDVIADAFLQQILTRPADYDVIATMNLNGDYISDALAAQVGGIGIAPGANINYQTGHAIFEATHGTAPKYAGKDQVNPGSVILSGEMMLRYLGWPEAADLIVQGIERAIAAKTVTYDFHRLMEGATKVKCSEFGEAVVRHMG